MINFFHILKQGFHPKFQLKHHVTAYDKKQIKMSYNTIYQLIRETNIP
jgi:hypothetical protein